MAVSNDSKSELLVKDHSVSGESFTLRYNPEYDLWKTDVPQKDRIGKYYESDAYISHTDSRKSLVDKLYQFVKMVMLSRKLKLIARYNPPGSMLDIGAGTGDFLEAAEKKGWGTVGIEPNDKASTLATEKGVDIHPDLISWEKKFDVITMWHVLEHVYDVEEYLQYLKNNLTKNGTVFIAVPNFHSYDANKYKQFWAAYDVPRHVYHFSKTAIQKLSVENGFEVVDIKPLIFDAYYVSLLSEKYRKLNFAFLRALIAGTQSNSYGMRKKEYSSHIYVLKHAKT